MRRIRYTGALLAAGLVVACGDPVTGPRSDARMDEARANGRAELIPNAIKYRDAGHHPATGRDGGATVTTRALLGRDGATRLEVYVGSLGGTGPGTFRHVQVKRFADDKSVDDVINAQPRGLQAWTLVLAGLERGDPLQVQAQVAGADGPRTGVVTLQDVVRRRPDLAVVSLDVPPSTWTHTPTMVSALVRELNGDVGARASCVLEVNDVPVDEAAGIWVDAGGTVSCAFAHLFTGSGAQAVRVRVTGVDPYDDDPANDAATATVIVVTEVPMSYSASADSGSGTYWSETFYDITSGGPPFQGYHRQTRDRRDDRYFTQRSSLTAWTREPLAFPEQPLTDVQLSQETGGATVHSASWASLPADNAVITPDSSTGCVARNTGASIVTRFSLCTRRVGTSSYSTLQYTWDAGDVTYQSQGYVNVQCSPFRPCQPRSYSYNTTTRTVTGTMVPFGTTFAFDVAFGSGAFRFTAAPEVTLSSDREAWGTPWGCTTGFGMGPEGIPGFWQRCTGTAYEMWHWHGMASRP